MKNMQASIPYLYKQIIASSLNQIWKILNMWGKKKRAKLFPFQISRLLRYTKDKQIQWAGLILYKSSHPIYSINVIV